MSGFSCFPVASYKKHITLLQYSSAHNANVIQYANAIQYNTIQCKQKESPRNRFIYMRNHSVHVSVHLYFLCHSCPQTVLQHSIGQMAMAHLFCTSPFCTASKFVRSLIFPGGAAAPQTPLSLGGKPSGRAALHPAQESCCFPQHSVPPPKSNNR